MTEPIATMAFTRRRGPRSTNRDEQRDAVMRMIFARPGFATVVAKELGVSHQNVSSWNKVPPHHVVKLAPLLDLTPEQIRPDIFGQKEKRR